MNAMTEVKSLLSTTKGKIVTALTMAMVTMMVSTVGASATTGGDTATVTAVTGAFDSVQATAMSILAAVGVTAILLFAGIYGWKYGKKVFSVVSR